MKALAVFPEMRELRVVERDEPRMVEPDDVELRMLDVGVCGTDREIAAFHFGTPPAGQDHLVLGHESLAEVRAVGPAVSDLAAGDLVVASVRRPCGQPSCAACRSGSQDFCVTGAYTERGIKEADGFCCEVVVEKRRYLDRVPAALRPVAVLVEPLTIAEKAMRQLAQIKDRMPWLAETHEGGGRAALVLGAGPVGLLGAMALSNADYRTFVYSREPAGGPKARIVESFGGTYLSAADHGIEAVPELMGGVDLVYEATGASSLSFRALPLLSANAVFIFTGVPGNKGPIEVDADAIMRNVVLKNQLIFGTVNAGEQAFAAAIADLEIFNRRWPEAVAALISGRHEIDGAIDLLSTGVPGIKHVVALG